MRYLFVSDLHIGDLSKADDFGDNDLRFAGKCFDQAARYKYIIGDVYDLWQFKKKSIIKAHRGIDKYIKDTFDAVLVGNHDYSLGGINKLSLDIDGKKVLLIHGHQSDGAMSNPVIRGFVWLLGKIERFIPFIDNPECFMKTGAPEKVEKLARKYLDKGYDIVICGHSHEKVLKKYPNGKVYANCGTCQHGKFEGVIIENGEVRLI